ncbi:sulfatase-like hydrolase/transferase [Lacinutrix venerupis]|uniref:sulfatase-like hydrolase/transferase n=1 Tax=Lacinutrix venerupis TaxID=1486034 RepID=UPI0012EC0A9B|nr:sulfatase-like hydrolase/transferase [Lacinutrix venerupis]
MAISKNIISILKLGAIYLCPVLFFLVYALFLIPNTIDYFKELLAFTLFSLIFYALSLLLKNRLRQIFTIIALAILFALLIIKLSFYSHYGVKINASALFVILETNGVEASEFFVNYFNKTVIVLLIAGIIGFTISVYLFKAFLNCNFEMSVIFKILSVFYIIGSLLVINFKFSHENIILSSVKTFKDYKITKSNLKENLAKPLSNNIVVKPIGDKEKTYVVIIGESTSRWHMQLYGYARETNPKLTEIKNELLIFNNVIASNVHTLRALEKSLTLSDFKSPNRIDNASIVQMANAAGFETFWISNQKPVGFYESIPTIISSAAKHKTYVNTQESSDVVLDENLLPHINKALNNTAKQKLIFIHLMGTHSTYNKRYPKDFDVFKEATNENLKAKKVINEYDNAILYNDFVVREIIESVKSKNQNSYVVYFSDHGDEVYDTFDFVGHNEFHGTKPMYEVPFIVWFSKQYKQSFPELFSLENITNRPYILEDFIHSFSDISKITFNRFNEEKSIFNSNFKEKKRLIKKGEDYDKR